MKKFDAEQSVMLAQYFSECGVSKEDINQFLYIYGPEEVPSEEEKLRILKSEKALLITEKLRRAELLEKREESQEMSAEEFQNTINEAVAAFRPALEEKAEVDKFMEQLAANVGFDLKGSAPHAIAVPLDKRMTKEEIIARIQAAVEQFTGLPKK